jgi:hypothetical protein
VIALVGEEAARRPFDIECVLYRQKMSIVCLR